MSLLSNPLRNRKPEPIFSGSAIVFGGSEGIGFAIAQQLAMRGVSVGLVSRSPDKLKLAHDQIIATRASDSVYCITISADVTDAASITSACNTMIEQLDDISLVVNSAGYTLPGYVDVLLPENYIEQWQHNCLGMLHIVQAMLPHFRSRGGGQFVGTASLLGLMGMFGYSAYASSKFALVGLLSSLRAELAPEKIGVTALCPPAVDTPGFIRENAIKPNEVLKAERRAGVLSAEQVALSLLHALPRNPARVIPSHLSRLVFVASRWMPGIVERMLQRPKL